MRAHVSPVLVLLGIRIVMFHEFSEDQPFSSFFPK